MTPSTDSVVKFFCEVSILYVKRVPIAFNHQSSTVQSTAKGCAAHTFTTSLPSPPSQHHQTSHSHLSQFPTPSASPSNPTADHPQSKHPLSPHTTSLHTCFQAFPSILLEANQVPNSVSSQSQYPPSRDSQPQTHSPSPPARPNDFETCVRSLSESSEAGKSRFLSSAFLSFCAMVRDGDQEMRDHPGLKITDQRLESSLPGLLTDLLLC